MGPAGWTCPNDRYRQERIAVIHRYGDNYTEQVQKSFRKVRALVAEENG